MKIGFLQFEPLLGDMGETLRRVEGALAESGKWDLMVLPELADTGYRLGTKENALALGTEPENNALLSLLKKECASRGAHAVAGFCERDGDRPFNSAALVGPNGVQGVYRKLHLFMDEKDIFHPGDLGLPVFDIGGCKLGIQICFDWMFPESWRVLALKGADIICHPSNLVLPHSQKVTPAYSLVNRVFIVTANRVGEEDGLAFTGGSQITDPAGRVLGSAHHTSPVATSVQIEIEAAANKMITERNHAFDDRRPSEYGKLVGD